MKTLTFFSLNPSRGGGYIISEDSKNHKVYKGVKTYYRVESKKVIKNGKCIRKWKNNSRRGLQQ